MTAPSFSILSAALSCHALHDPPNHLHLGKEPRLQTSLQNKSYSLLQGHGQISIFSGGGASMAPNESRNATPSTYASWPTSNEMAERAYLVSWMKTCSVSVRTQLHAPTRHNPERFHLSLRARAGHFFAYRSIIRLLRRAVYFCSLGCEIISPIILLHLTCR